MDEASGRAPIVLCDVTQMSVGAEDEVSRALTGGLRSINPISAKFGVCQMRGFVTMRQVRSSNECILVEEEIKSRVNKQSSRLDNTLQSCSTQ